MIIDWFTDKTKYDLAKAAQQEVIDVDSGSADDRDRRSTKKSSKKRRSPPAPKRRRPWLHVDIVVRIVDERSRHYKEKMVVLDVVDGGHAAQLRTMDNKVLDRDMPAHYLETVVPRQVGGWLIDWLIDNLIDSQEDALVKVLNAGGLLARLIEQDRKKQKAIIEMVDNDETRQVHFDDISQYVEHDWNVLSYFTRFNDNKSQMKWHCEICQNVSCRKSISFMNVRTVQVYE